ncbi:MAG: MTAP family purine nucleoside phosphorylase [Chloroflexi bacterium]|nr:MTAP family purine nucleoside phosphorylase [Chloroflexota bacterium]
MESARIAVIGGSGLYNMPAISDLGEVQLDTPFGAHSGVIRIGSLGGKRIAFLPRHGEGHTLSPSTLPYRANIFALKQLGVRFIIAVNAVGSLCEDYAPGHIATIDQIIDYTIQTRPRSFFEDGLVAHVSVADPTSAYLRAIIADAVEAAGGTAHRGATILVEDGPRFATRAESHLFRSWGCHLIGMTSAPEAFLAREAEIAYAALAHVTDFDSWHAHEADVTSELVIETLIKNIELVRRALAFALAQIDEDHIDPAHTALGTALATPHDAMDATVIDRLRPVLARVLNLD